MFFLRNLVWKVLKSLLFRLDAETAHQMTSFLIRIGIGLKGIPLKIVSGSSFFESQSERDPNQKEVFEMQFRSCVGLAAGFDKNAELVLGLPSLGFGFAEIGTVTPRPQPGNDRPRLFRSVSERALFNRMGFNNLGATLIAQRLERSRSRLPENFRIGVNLGKNRDTPLEKATSDYCQAARKFEGLADYMVINVSSPNTPGLRSLQKAESLKPLVYEVKQVISGWKKTPPLLLKLAPEIEASELKELIQNLEEFGVDGWILTNTLGGKFYSEPAKQEVEGGWSGSPLAEASRKSLLVVRSVTQKPIISVGGIDSLEEAEGRLRAGASLIQVYTGWIYQGPSFPVKLTRQLRKL